MSKPIDIELQVNKKKEADVLVDVDKKKEVDIALSSTHNGYVPWNGLEGQVLTKTKRGYKWEDNPLSVDTWDDLPEEPSTHTIYLVRDDNKLIRWDKLNSEWIVINPDFPDLGELAYKDGGYVEVTTFDDITINDYTPTGSIDVDLEDSTEQATIYRNNYTPSGSVSTPSITVTTNTDTIQPVATLGNPTTLDLTKFDGGEEATWTGYSYTAPTLGQPTTNSFAISGVNVAMNNGTLTITDALTSNAVTAQGTFTSGNVNFGVFNGGKSAKLNDGFYTEGTSPTLGDSKTFVSGATASLDTAPVFTGDEEVGLKVDSIDYLKPYVNSQTFTGNTQSIDYQVETSQKTIDVIFTEND